uniref:Uncharacterized protein n=1 Tax=Chromera velia CCMP2878 TaxID=1169474 RepID=A0A0G4FN52_9ALVE|eukprot:Cvel_17688.t1-p1 / transcript=Cvel_17688.t1 / gene=Cvel_17688 / organism=Chromera_velia_CCMP2878 / gene_product=hypothetical protein / transcript_product=hypothetical protein / location=Cvel_scaffold1427:4023-8579(+) / protein_length=386 / sequence_SO=supercontig / SO=protein_coding / is_pseudo=false
MVLRLRGGAPEKKDRDQRATGEWQNSRGNLNRKRQKPDGEDEGFSQIADTFKALLVCREINGEPCCESRRQTFCLGLSCFCIDLLSWFTVEMEALVIRESSSPSRYGTLPSEPMKESKHEGGVIYHKTDENCVFALAVRQDEGTEHNIRNLFQDLLTLVLDQLETTAGKSGTVSVKEATQLINAMSKDLPRRLITKIHKCKSSCISSGAAPLKFLPVQDSTGQHKGRQGAGRFSGVPTLGTNRMPTEEEHRRGKRDGEGALQTAGGGERERKERRDGPQESGRLLPIEESPGACGGRGKERLPDIGEKGFGNTGFMKRLGHGVMYHMCTLLGLQMNQGTDPEVVSLLRQDGCKDPQDATEAKKHLAVLWSAPLYQKDGKWKTAVHP